MLEKKFATRLKKLRVDKELSQEGLAKALKTYQTNVARWELGKVIPNAETLIQLAVIFDVTVDYLLGLHNNPSISYASNIKAIDDISATIHQSGNGNKINIKK